MLFAQIDAQGVGAVMVEQQTAFLTESGLEADNGDLHQVAITHQAHQVYLKNVVFKLLPNLS